MKKETEGLLKFVEECGEFELLELEKLIHNRKIELRKEHERLYRLEVQKRGSLFYTDKEFCSMCWEAIEVEVKKYYDQKLAKMLKIRKLSYLDSNEHEKDEKESTEDYFYLVSYENNEKKICYVKINIVNIPFH